MLQFDWNILWTIINIIILCVLLRVFLWKPINKIIEERRKAITASLDEAQKAKEEAEKAKSEYEESIRNADKEADDIIADAKVRAQAEYDARIKSAQDDADKLIKETEKNVELKKSQAMAEAQTQVASIALSAAEKLLEKNIDAESNAKLIQSFLMKAGVNNDSE